MGGERPLARAVSQEKPDNLDKTKLYQNVSENGVPHVTYQVF
jgi:hypothetical protein